MLQTRNAKRTAEAAVRIALDLVAEGLIDKRRAVGMVNAQSLDQLFHARIDPARPLTVACKGLNASPGAAAGQIVFSAEDAVAWKEEGRKTDPGTHRDQSRRRARHDRRGRRADRRRAARRRTLPSSHGAWASRALPAAMRCSIDYRKKSREFRRTDLARRRLDYDRRHDRKRRGRRTTSDSAAVETARLASDVSVVGRRAAANAGLGERRHARGRGKGARTGRARHRALPYRAHVHATRAAADRSRDDPRFDDEERARALARLLPFQRDDFSGILRRDGGPAGDDSAARPAAARVLAVARRAARRNDRAAPNERASNRRSTSVKDAMLRRVRQLHEQNPMLGLRVCRLGIVFPEIYEMQVRAIFEAACELKREGVDRAPDVMIPGVGTKEEMQATRDAAKRGCGRRARASAASTYLSDRHDDRAAARLRRRRRAWPRTPSSSRSARTISRRRPTATAATTPKHRSFPVYLEKRILKDDPFQVLDRRGVGTLMKQAVALGRGVRRASRSGSAASTAANRAASPSASSLGLDYVSCSPFRVPIARLAAAQAAIGALH